MSDAAFHTTRWSLVLQAGLQGEQDQSSAQALSDLCQVYWYPLYAYARRRGYSEPDAKDLIQGFFAHLLERGTLAVADPNKGRFRSYLLGSLKNHLVNEQRHRGAIKRGGQTDIVSIDAATGEQQLLAETADERDPETLYHRSWAEALLNQALNRLRTAHEEADKLALFEQLEPLLTGSNTDSPDRKEIAATLDTTETAVNISLHRMRKRYGDLVRESIADTVGDPSEVDDELRFLKSVLRESA